MRIAILCTGQLKNFRWSFPQWVQHIVKTNDADVFLSLKRDDVWVQRDPKINDPVDPESIIRGNLGDRLKGLQWTGKEYDLFSEPIFNKCQRREKSYKRSLIKKEKDTLHQVPSKPFWDQFCRLLYGFEHFEQQLKHYDRIVRFRIDMYIPEPILFPLENSIVPRDTVSLSELWISNFSTFKIMCNFIHHYGEFVPKNRTWRFVLIPEVQLAQYVRRERLRFRSWNLHYGYQIHPERGRIITCYMTSTSVNSREWVQVLDQDKTSQDLEGVVMSKETYDDDVFIIGGVFIVVALILILIAIYTPINPWYKPYRKKN